MMLVVVAYDVSTESEEGTRRLRRLARVCENRGQRVQRFVYKGLAMVTKQDQGVVWPRGSK